MLQISMSVKIIMVIVNLDVSTLMDPSTVASALDLQPTMILISKVL